jgi:hypothetical protein
LLFYTQQTQKLLQLEMWSSLPSSCTKITTGSVMQNIKYTYHTNNNLAPGITWFIAFHFRNICGISMKIFRYVHPPVCICMETCKVPKASSGNLILDNYTKTIEQFHWIGSIPSYLKMHLHPCVHKCSYPANTLREHNKDISSCKNVNYVFQTFYVS